jgi:DNA-binding response OmpR family regulator
MSKIYDVISVEDDDDLYALLLLVLKELPISIRRARNGHEALSLVDQAKPNLLLLDLALPDMRGWDVLDRAAVKSKLAGVPVIVLTSHTEVPHRVIGKVQEVAAYVRKPFNPDEFRALIRQSLGIA